MSQHRVREHAAHADAARGHHQSGPHATARPPSSTSSRAAPCSSSGGHPASRSFLQRSERAAPHQADPWRAMMYLIRTPPSRFSFFVPNQRDLGGASAPLGGASCAPGAARRRGPLADGPSRGARPVGVALTRRARPPASFPAGPRTVPRECRHSPVHPEFCRFS